MPEDPGLVLVDATWGNIQPQALAPGVRTVAELELIAHVRAGLPLIDSRRVEQFVLATIQNANDRVGPLPRPVLSDR